MSMIHLKRSLVLALLLGVIPGLAWAEPTGTLITQLRIRLGQTDSTNSNWTNTELRHCLNMGQRWINAQGRVIEKRGFVAGGAMLRTAPSGYIKMRGTAFLWRNGKPTVPIPLTALDSLPGLLGRISTQMTGRDKYYMIEYNDSIMVLPTTPTGDSILFYYYGEAAKLDTTTECDYDDAWEQVLLVAAKVIALEKIESPDIPFWVQERDKLVAAMYQQQTLKPQMTSVP